MDTQAEILIQECINEQKEELCLSDCKLPSTVPLLEKIRHHDHIKYLDLSRAKIQHVVIKDLPHLIALDLSNNAIEYVELSGLPKLGMLYLGRNKLFANVAENEYYPKAELIEHAVDLVRRSGIQSVYTQQLLQDFENSDLETHIKIRPVPELFSDAELGQFMLSQLEPKLTWTVDVLAMLGKILNNGVDLQNFETGVKLDELPSLKFLDLSYNNIKSLDFLPIASKLEYLKLEHNVITDISSLTNFPQLKSLSVQYNKIEDFTPLKTLRYLAPLYGDTVGNPATWDE